MKKKGEFNRKKKKKGDADKKDYNNSKEKRK